MAETQTKVQEPNKVFYYYPAFNEKFVRRTLAGIVEGGVLYVAQAVVFPGSKAQYVPVKLRNGTTVYIIDPGVPADHFVKAHGRALAKERVTGIKVLADGKSAKVGKKCIFQAQLPEGDVNPGKFFVEQVELYLKAKGFPPKIKKEKKKEEAGPAPENV